LNVPAVVGTKNISKLHPLPGAMGAVKQLELVVATE
jgi:hypothetical protein